MRLWRWVVGLIAAAGTMLLGLAAWRKKPKRDPRSKALAEEAARLARERAREKLEAAVARGQDAVAEADKEANDAVANNDGDLCSYLTDRDPGPS